MQTMASPCGAWIWTEPSVCPDLVQVDLSIVSKPQGQVPNSIWVITELSQGLDIKIKKKKKKIWYTKLMLHSIALRTWKNTTSDMENCMVIQVVISGEKLGHDPPRLTSQRAQWTITFHHFLLYSVFGLCSVCLNFVVAIFISDYAWKKPWQSCAEGPLLLSLLLFMC